MPKFSPSHAIIFAPVNFLGSADSDLHFKVMGETNYSEFWSGYPKFMRFPSGKNDEASDNAFDEVELETDGSVTELEDSSTELEPPCH